MNRKEIFNKVKTHLLKQNARCVKAGTCEYQNDDGLRCAIGGIMPDDHPALKVGGTVRSILMRFPDLQKIWGVENEEDIQFLLNLQAIHDQYKPADWEEELNAITPETK